MTINVYLGIDVGSVTTKLALVDETGKYIDSYMLRTSGKPVIAVQTGMRELMKQALCDYSIQGVGTTGSGRNLAGALVGADVIKNEIIVASAVPLIPITGVNIILRIIFNNAPINVVKKTPFVFFIAT